MRYTAQRKNWNNSSCCECVGAFRFRRMNRQWKRELLFHMIHVDESSLFERYLSLKIPIGISILTVFIGLTVWQTAKSPQRLRRSEVSS